MIEWNEDNFDIDTNAYTRMCHEQKKYAFLTDYIRLVVVEQYGGIYFDTDVEVIRNFDDLLGDKAFFCFEDDQYVNTGEGFGSEAHHPVVQQMIQEYGPLLDGKHDLIGCPRLNTNALLHFGLQQNGSHQIIGNAVIYPKEYFNPMNNNTGELQKTVNTHSIHWYSMSWISPAGRLRSKITRPIHKLFGEDVFHRRWKK
jgi:hypothetical protein